MGTVAQELKKKARRLGRETLTSDMARELLAGGTPRLGKWSHYRPSMVLVMDGDDISFEDMYELDWQFLDALNSALTPLGYCARISGSWLEGELVFTRKASHNA